jgi:adenine phosphoribosyltransferase
VRSKLDLGSYVDRVDDFPNPGERFYDITGLLADGAAFRSCIESMAKLYQDRQIGVVAGLEASSFFLHVTFGARDGAFFYPCAESG